MSLGSGDQIWAITFFGTIQADYITDTTRSYNDYHRPDAGRPQRHVRRDRRANAVLDAQHARRLLARFAAPRRREPVGGVPGRLRGQPAGRSLRDPRARQDRSGNLGERLLQQPDVPDPPRLSDATQPVRRHPGWPDVRRVRLAELLPAPLLAAGPSEPDLVAHHAVQAVAELRRGRAGRPSTSPSRRRARRSATRRCPTGRRRPPQRQRLEGDHDAGQRGDDRRAAFVSASRASPASSRSTPSRRRRRSASNHTVGWGVSVRRLHPGHPRHERQRSRQPADAGRIVRVRDGHRRPHGRGRRRAVPDAAELRCRQARRPRTRPTSTTAWSRSICSACCTRSTGGRPRAASSTTSRLRALHPVGKLHVRALAQHRQAVPEGRHRDRAPRQRRRQVDVGDGEPAVGRDARRALRPLRPVHPGALPRTAGNEPHNIRGIGQALYTF